MEEKKNMPDNNVKAKKTIKDIIKVSISNIIKLLSGVLVGFVLPRLIGITDYGYYKTFTLYASYVGLFAFGIIDGIYLKYGGLDYKELSKSDFRFYTRILALLHLVIAISGIGISLLFLSGEYKFIFVSISCYLIFSNMTGYYQQVSQITGRFNELSTRNIIQSIFVSLSVIVIWLVNKLNGFVITYNIYLFIYVSIFAVLTLWYIITYKDITFGSDKETHDKAKKIFNLIKIGFPLLIANLCSTLILSMDRQFVNILWPVDETNNTYSIYAFAYNMLSLVTTATAAISTVLYPSLKRTSQETLKSNYSKLLAIIISLISCALVVYYPLCWFVDWFLPKYHDSLMIFRIIFPGLITSSAITIIMHNYYKVFGESFRFFIITIIVLLISFVANLIAYLIFKSVSAISIASIITMLIWYIISEFYFIRHYNVNWIKNFVFMIVMMGSFYVITFISNYYIGFTMHFISIITLVYLFNLKDINVFIKRKLKSKKLNSKLKNDDISEI
ncbi:MAG: hypothetical protein IKP77_02450 [Acholeplasmatales bacterium]|nr:hypothetical protein [Acholeplasmatales bacterium]